MSGVLRWQDPPPSPHGAHRRRETVPAAARLHLTNPYQDAAADLIERPGVWGVVTEGEQGMTSTIASRIRAGAYVSFTPAGTFDAVSRKAGPVTVVYARYLGMGGA